MQIPIVPYGGATSIEGHTLAPDGGVCVDMSLMNVRCLCVQFLLLTSSWDVITLLECEMLVKKLLLPHFKCVEYVKEAR